LLVSQAEAEASVADIPEPLDVIGHGFSHPISNNHHIGQSNLAHPDEEVLVKFLFQIGPPIDRVKW
jgi:hypothetical protein